MWAGLDSVGGAGQCLWANANILSVSAEVIASSPTPDPAPDPTLSSNPDTSPISPSLTQTIEVSTVARETTVAPPAFSSAQPHLPQNTATVRPPSPTPLNRPTANEPIDATANVGPGMTHGFPDFLFPDFPGPTEDHTDPSPSGSPPSQSQSRTISAFDMASIVVGAIALVLVVLLVTIVAVLLCRHRHTPGRLKTV